MSSPLAQYARLDAGARQGLNLPLIAIESNLETLARAVAHTIAFLMERYLLACKQSGVDGGPFLIQALAEEHELVNDVKVDPVFKNLQSNVAAAQTPTKSAPSTPTPLSNVKTNGTVPPAPTSTNSNKLASSSRDGSATAAAAGNGDASTSTSTSRKRSASTASKNPTAKRQKTESTDASVPERSVITLAPFIRQYLLLPSTDYTLVSAKHVRHALVEMRVPGVTLAWTREHKEELNGLIAEEFTKIDADAGEKGKGRMGRVKSGDHDATTPPTGAILAGATSTPTAAVVASTQAITPSSHPATSPSTFTSAPNVGASPPQASPGPSRPALKIKIDNPPAEQPGPPSSTSSATVSATLRAVAVESASATGSAVPQARSESAAPLAAAPSTASTSSSSVAASTNSAVSTSMQKPTRKMKPLARKSLGARPWSHRKNHMVFDPSSSDGDDVTRTDTPAKKALPKDAEEDGTSSPGPQDEPRRARKSNSSWPVPVPRRKTPPAPKPAPPLTPTPKPEPAPPLQIQYTPADVDAMDSAVYTHAVNSLNSNESRRLSETEVRAMADEWASQLSKIVHGDGESVGVLPHSANSAAVLMKRIIDRGNASVEVTAGPVAGLSAVPLNASNGTTPAPGPNVPPSTASYSTAQQSTPAPASPKLSRPSTTPTAIPGTSRGDELKAPPSPLLARPKESVSPIAAMKSVPAALVQSPRAVQPPTPTKATSSSSGPHQSPMAARASASPLTARASASPRTPAPFPLPSPMRKMSVEMMIPSVPSPPRASQPTSPTAFRHPTPKIPSSPTVTVQHSSGVKSPSRQSTAPISTSTPAVVATPLRSQSVNPAHVPGSPTAPVPVLTPAAVPTPPASPTVAAPSAPSPAIEAATSTPPVLPKLRIPSLAVRQALSASTTPSHPQEKEKEKRARSQTPGDSDEDEFEASFMRKRRITNASG
ncbi:hypothetical protein EXIGLDRAFT_832204 [Exidia glandulosa HHB12029]|uniref:Uncharacterized protein n=1 Tax=Exidia glandulosa HHB12029 TaxID=1314781 RepID=A0A165LVW9_EXIGL|nr:hypothetical protein EXIGLDRAFT_832204 [Exidia glandulosa HHB12029]